MNPAPPYRAWSPTVACLHLLFCVAHPLWSNQGVEGMVTWGMSPRGCEGTGMGSHSSGQGGARGSGSAFALLHAWGQKCYRVWVSVGAGQGTSARIQAKLLCGHSTASDSNEPTSGEGVPAEPTTGNVPQELTATGLLAPSTPIPCAPHPLPLIPDPHLLSLLPNPSAPIPLTTCPSSSIPYPQSAQ